MNIPDTSMALAHANTNINVSTSMMKKSLDQVKQQGENLEKMMESTNVATATKLDYKI